MEKTENKNEKNTAGQTEEAPEKTETASAGTGDTEKAETAEQTEATGETEKKEKHQDGKLRGGEKHEYEKKLAALEAALAGEKEKYLRMMAEYDNFRKRTKSEHDALYADAYADALSALLPIIDNIGRASACTDADGLQKGMAMINDSISGALSRMGVEEIGREGEAFDPARHNAVMHEENPELPENTVAQVLQKGYAKGGKIIRCAMVKVAN